ncbi:MAG: class I SAM-dependent methyltransferase [Halobacteriota archaeon]|nr:class I SAM-dependent methyltransferase [Halobacteriota archaeon]
MSDTERYLKSLEITAPLQDPIMRSAIEELNLKEGSRGLDVGCGIGLQVMMLAEAVGDKGHVTGLDISSEFLTYAEEISKKKGLSDRTAFLEGSMEDLPFDDDTFDWAWSANCVGYNPHEPIPLVKELKRVVKPKGTVALIAWSSEELLPGYPMLEARLKGTTSGIAPFGEGKKPETHFHMALSWFNKLGFEGARARVFSGSVCAPLGDKTLEALSALIEMRWPNAESELEPKFQKEFQQLCDPDSPDFILNLPDYYAFFTYSMFWGKVPDEG